MLTYFDSDTRARVRMRSREGRKKLRESVP